ncbi:Protein MOTHER of FT and TF 1, partial [Ananas comosus]
HVNNGCDVKPSAAASPPTVRIAGRASDLYTLIMTDPDAPSPSEPTMREWIHWMVVNIPGGKDPSQVLRLYVHNLCIKTYNCNFSGAATTAAAGQEVVEYMGPQPPVGIHRYVLVLFEQKSQLASVASPAARPNFNTRVFAAQHDLGLPVAAVYFNSQKEPMSARRRRR